MSKTRTLTIEVLRYRPEIESEPVFQSYQVPCPQEWVILDALNYIKDHIDTSLSYRWSCHMAVCGSCGVMVNGEPVLACKTFIRYMDNIVRVEPLLNLPIERDLVVVMNDFMEKLANIRPYIIHKTQRAIKDGPYLQTPAQLKRFKQFTLCINCLLCYAACPQYSLNPSFIGPSALALAHRYNLDSRDEGRALRQEVTASHEGVWECSFVGACSEVCPKHVDPAAAIQQMKITSTKDYFFSFFGEH